MIRQYVGPDAIGARLDGHRLKGERAVQEERMLKDVIGGIRDVRVGPDGYVRLLNNASDGVIACLDPRRRLTLLLTLLVPWHLMRS